MDGRIIRNRVLVGQLERNEGLVPLAAGRGEEVVVVQNWQGLW